MRASVVCTAVAALALGGLSLVAAPSANASEVNARAPSDVAATDMSARKRVAKRHRGTSLRVTRLSRRATETPDPNRTYYRPAPAFFPFAADRGYF